MFAPVNLRISWDETLGLIAEDDDDRMIPIFLRYPEQTHEDMEESWYTPLLDAMPLVAVKWVNVERLPLEDLYVEEYDAQTE
jgi:hypothetical protein